jgi:hypothetical protein
VNPQEKQADDGPLANQLSISVLLRIAGRNTTARMQTRKAAGISSRGLFFLSALRLFYLVASYSTSFSSLRHLDTQALLSLPRSGD